MARFEPDRQKHIPDHGAQCILEEYIARWKLRIKQTRTREEDPQSSSDAEHVVAESSSTLLHSPTANATERQVPAPTVRTESAPPEHVAAVLNESPIQTPSISGTAGQPSLASKQTIEPDVWTIADAQWDHVRQVEAEASRRHTRLFGESSFRHIYIRELQLEFFARSVLYYPIFVRGLVRSERSSLIGGVHRYHGQRPRFR